MTKITLKKLDGSRIEITGEIDEATFESYRPKAIKKMNESVKVDGFRAGHVPESVLVARVGETAILEEMAHNALEAGYPALVIEHKLEVLGPPQVRLTKVAKGNPLGFVLTVPVLPEVELGDYKKLAREAKKKEAPSVEVSEAELVEALGALQKHKNQSAQKPNKPQITETLAQTTQSLNPSEQNLNAEATAGAENTNTLDDEFARSVGDFKDLAELKAKLREEMTKEKEQARLQSVRHNIIEALVKGAKVEVPDVLIEQELERMLSETFAEAKRYSIEKEAYLKAGKTSEEKLRTEWREQARKRVAAELAMREVGIKEKVEVSKETIDTEVEKLLKLYPEAKKENARRYLSEQMTKEAILKRLEEI